MLKFMLKGQRGFTLLELTVVVSILGVLAGMVSASVAGAKGASQEGQVQSDGKSTETAVVIFNNKFINSTFPDTSVVLDVLPENRYTPAFDVGFGGGLGVALIDKRGNPVGTLASIVKTLKGEEVSARSILNFDATTAVFQEDGTITEAFYTPDFLLKQPGSLILEADETKDLGGNPFLEYLWLLKLNSPGSQQESRRVEIYRLTNAICYSGGAAPTSVQGQAEAAFNDILGGTDTSTVSTTTGTYVGPVTFQGAAVTVAGHPSLRMAGAEVNAAKATLATAKATLKGAEKALADAEAALATAVAANVGVDAATAQRDAKRTARDNAQKALNSGVAAQAAAQTVLNRARAIAAAAQAEASKRATAAGAKCIKDNVAVALTYRQVF